MTARGSSGRSVSLPQRSRRPPLIHVSRREWLMMMVVMMMGMGADNDRQSRRLTHSPCTEVLDECLRRHVDHLHVHTARHLCVCTSQSQVVSSTTYQQLPPVCPRHAVGSSTIAACAPFINTWDYHDHIRLAIIIIIIIIIIKVERSLDALSQPR
jgi:hypothetical protein